MATLADTLLTIADKMKRQNADHKIAMIIEMLHEFTSLVEDAPARECNNGSRHRTTLRTILPAIAWRVINRGVPNTKSGTAQVEDTTGMMEAFSQVDEALVALEGDGPAFRLSESAAFLEAMAQEAEDSLFNADTNLDPEEILGFSPRFNDLNAANGGQIVDAGGTGSDNHSIWFVTWGEQACTLIYPKGTEAGLVHNDLGLDNVFDASNNRFRAWIDQYKWNLGLSVRDFRSVVRIANIDDSLLTNDVSTGADLFQQLTAAWWRMTQKTTATGNTIIYANATILEFLDNQSRTHNSNLHISIDEAGPGSQPVMRYRGHIIRRTDALLDGSEARVIGL